MLSGWRMSPTCLRRRGVPWRRRSWTTRTARRSPWRVVPAECLPGRPVPLCRRLQCRPGRQCPPPCRPRSALFPRHGSTWRNRHRPRPLCIRRLRRACAGLHHCRCRLCPSQLPHGRLWPIQSCPRLLLPMGCLLRRAVKPVMPCRCRSSSMPMLMPRRCPSPLHGPSRILCPPPAGLRPSPLLRLGRYPCLRRGRGWRRLIRCTRRSGCPVVCRRHPHTSGHPPRRSTAGRVCPPGPRCKTTPYRTCPDG